MVLVIIITITVIITFELSKSWAAKYNWEIGKFSACQKEAIPYNPQFRCQNQAHKYIHFQFQKHFRKEKFLIWKAHPFCNSSFFNL